MYELLQINTEQMKQELGCLDVNVPPDIDMEQTSSDVTVQVMQCMELGCIDVNVPLYIDMEQTSSNVTVQVRQGLSYHDVYVPPQTLT